MMYPADAVHYDQEMVSLLLFILLQMDRIDI